MIGQINFIGITDGATIEGGNVAIMPVKRSTVNEETIKTHSVSIDPDRSFSIARQDVDIYLGGLMRDHFDATLPENAIRTGTKKAYLFYSAEDMSDMLVDVDDLVIDIGASAPKGGLRFISKKSCKLINPKKVGVPLVALDFYRHFSEHVKHMLQLEPESYIYAFLVR